MRGRSEYGPDHWRRLRCRVVANLILIGTLSSACGGKLRPFPPSPVVWEDDDRVPIAKAPESFYSPYIWDGMDQSTFRPLAKMFGLYDRQGEAENINALDEVPNSSWYTNRLSVQLMSPDDVARGACPDLNDELPLPWTITGGKPDGSNPGFFIRDGAGRRYLLKTDGELQSERPTGSDVVGAAMFYAAGYYAPCNRVVTVTLDKLQLSPEAEVKLTSGFKEKMTDKHVRQVLSKATSLGDGKYRASVSQFIEGRPISPWIYEGTRKDDPNDVVPHAFRREIRGMYVLTAWTDHIDSRQENTLASWIETGPKGAGYVRHYMIDFGDTLGIIFAWDDLTRRFGYSGYFDIPDMTVDFFTLGLLDRPWHHAKYSAAGKELGYYDGRRFVPDKWKPGYPNPAFQRHTERDAAWMTRIIARMQPPHIVALVNRGRWTKPIITSELIRILVERRRRILERYLTRLSPLTWPVVNDMGPESEVCMQDLAVWTGIRNKANRTYETQAWSGQSLERVRLSSPRSKDDAWVCQTLPNGLVNESKEPRYLIVDMMASTSGQDQPGPARLHFWVQSGQEPKLVGLERPKAAGRPKS